MGEMAIKKVFKQHASRVVTLPWWVLKELSIERGDYVVFEESRSGKYVKFYKWHVGVDKEYPDYGNVNLRDQDRQKRVKRGAR